MSMLANQLTKNSNWGWHHKVDYEQDQGEEDKTAGLERGMLMRQTGMMLDVVVGRFGVTLVEVQGQFATLQSRMAG